MSDPIVVTKKWWQSKTIWAGVVAVLIAGYNSATVQFHLPAIPDFVFAVLGAFGIYNRTQTDTKIG